MSFSISPDFIPRHHVATRAVLLAWLLAAWGASPICAQELQTQPTPLSAYLDLRPAPEGAEPQTTPAWIESFEFVPGSTTAADRSINVPSTPPDQFGATVVPASDATNVKSAFRIRLQRPAGATDHLQVRVFFDDAAQGRRPRLTAWNELGSELMQSAPLGQNLGLSSSETLYVPMAGVDYLEIETTGDGSRIRGVFLTWLTRAHILQPTDFPSAESVREPFGVLPAARGAHDDAYLYGVVTAGLQDEKPLVLQSGHTPGATYQFALEQQPLLAIVTYEVLGTTVGAPPLALVNGRAQGESEVHLPDLADPGFRGESEEGRPQMSFRYTGWLHAQKVIPGAALAAGLNNLTIQLSKGSKAIAIRSVSIQLKYNWEKLDYILSPAPVPYETP